MKTSKVLMLFIAMTFCLGIFAQGVVPTPGVPPPRPPGLPIDGGLLFLIISGAVYGVSKLKE